MRASCPDIVITDICMGTRDGIEFGRLAKSEFPATKIIVLTGYDYLEFAQRSIRAGLDDFLLKPVNPLEIRKAIEKAETEICTAASCDEHDTHLHSLARNTGS